MASVNKAILVGHLGRDPEVRYTKTGVPVCNFSLATADSWKDKEGIRQESTEWHQVVVWGKLAEACSEYLAKGRGVFVEGQMKRRSWDDTDAGVKRFVTEVHAYSVQFLGAKPAVGRSADRVEGDAVYDYGPPPMTDDVPF